MVRSGNGDVAPFRSGDKTSELVRWIRQTHLAVSAWVSACIAGALVVQVVPDWWCTFWFGNIYFQTQNPAMAKRTTTMGRYDPLGLFAMLSAVGRSPYTNLIFGGSLIFFFALKVHFSGRPACQKIPPSRRFEASVVRYSCGIFVSESDVAHPTTSRAILEIKLKVTATNFSCVLMCFFLVF